MNNPLPPALVEVRNAIRDIPNFPKEGVLFKDITPIVGSGDLFRKAVDAFIEATRPLNVSKVIGIDARGFIFGSAVACQLELGFVPVRKKGKLPFLTDSVSYALEYGEATIEMHVDALCPGERVVLIDDLLATGGTSAAAAKLVEQRGAILVEAQFLIELTFLNGREKLAGIPVRTFIPL